MQQQRLRYAEKQLKHRTTVKTRRQKDSHAVRAARLDVNVEKVSDPNGTRTRVTGVKGRCPRPLDDGASAQHRRMSAEILIPGPPSSAIQRWLEAARRLAKAFKLYMVVTAERQANQEKMRGPPIQKGVNLSGRTESTS